MKHHSKLAQEQQHTEQPTGAHATRHQAGQEFASADELIRFDAAQTAVPAQIAERLKQSAASLPPPPRPWWRSLLGH